MTQTEIDAALGFVAGESDPTRKALALASLVSAVFAEAGVALVVVGGSAIEVFTEGAYVSGDIDLCLLPESPALALRARQELMGRLRGEGGPRSWKVVGLFVDLLGPVETFARTPFRRIQGPFGEVALIQPEELLVERVLVSVYPSSNPSAAQVARTLAAGMLVGRVATDWEDVWRIAARPEYGCLDECRALVQSVAHELGLRNPADPD
jgi:hypothetical protein